ncbi:hypothetical protein [Avibacterium paragallinarum]|uniref:hypothetical protein n=1 Tax=Avibacterium paragallinarum TaxID=728 RepID=UPI00397B7903
MNYNIISLSLCVILIVIVYRLPDFIRVYTEFLKERNKECNKKFVKTNKGSNKNDNRTQ